MGLTEIKVAISNPLERDRTIELDCLVDSGAIYSVIPGKVLRGLGIQPEGRRQFSLADTSKITRQTGEAYFRINGDEGTSKVVFGQKGDAILLGALTLECLGLMLDPLRREVRPMKLLMM